MKKRILSIILALSLMFSLAAVTSIAVSAEFLTSGDYQYYVNDDGTVKITRYIGEDKEEVAIPSEIDGKAVTVLDGYYYIDLNQYPDIYYNDYAIFSDFLHVKSVIIPDSVTSIGDYAFYGCDSLESVTIPDSVIDIGWSAFSGCELLTSVTIGNSVTSVGGAAFYDCASLKSVTIGNGVTSIGNSAFENTALYNDESNWENGVLYIGKYLISGKSEKWNKDTYEYDVITEAKGDYKIKDGTKVIADCAFEDCKLLTSVTIPDSVTSIGSCAFEDCELLTSVTIPDSVTSIGCEAFYKTALYNDESNWENGVLYIGNCLIAGRFEKNWEVITEAKGDYKIKDGTKVIADYAFYDCSSLTSLTIPDSVTSIGNKALGYCYYYVDEENEGTIKVDDFHINCYSNTAGEQYAIDNGFDYTLLDDPNEPSITIENESKLGSVEKTVNEDGTVTLNAKVSGSAQFRKWNISGDCEITSGALTSRTITIKLKSGNVTVSPVFENSSDPSTITYGDANGDGNIDMLDVLLIRKYIAKQPIELDTNIADVNCDSNVDMLDVLLIRKYIAKQPVHLGPQE